MSFPIDEFAMRARILCGCADLLAMSTSNGGLQWKQADIEDCREQARSLLTGTPKRAVS